MTPATLKTPATPNRLWRIVQARDRRYDDLFVYAVRSTGIYCRPSCPVVPPKPENMPPASYCRRFSGSDSVS